ncbi:hypothetical protein [uncultured Maricaulis sp.]|uniref:hypothetical protein n=1 Tax=uncultured Maricaulis sp. TaxID=174710 RepID=UPI0030DAD912|tara:strand:- start:2320 stop:2643 length:324 start_codon:yes stop_codon:yes gene_type:complete
MSFSLAKPCPNCGAAAYAKLWAQRSFTERLSDMASGPLTIRCWSCHQQIRADNRLAIAIMMAGMVLFGTLHMLGYLPREVAVWMSVVFALISAFLFVRYVVVKESEE